MPSVGLPAAAGPTRGMISGSVFRRPTRDRSWRDDMTDATNPVAALERGEVVAVYPEGTYTGDPDFWPMRSKNGIGRIAVMTGAPVIPVANWGTQDVLPPESRRAHFFPRRTVRIVAGPPVDLSAFRGGPRTRSNLD